MPVVLLKLIATIYAILVLIGGLLAADDSSVLGYPQLLVFGTIVASIALAQGILSLAYRWYPTWVRNYWKPTFAFCVIDFVVGTLMDAAMPSDYNLTTHGVAWLLNTAVVVLFLAPAFYLNFKLAFHRHG